MFGRLRNYLQRRTLRRLSRERALYAAAQAGRLIGEWTPYAGNVNTLIAASSPLIRARTMQLVRDFPPFWRAVNNLVDFVVGRGMLFQSRALGLDGEADKGLRRDIEDRFRAWMDEADAAGRLHFYELQQLAVRQDAEAGEYLAVVAAEAPQPFALQFYEADRLTGAMSRPEGKNKLEQGIEYDALTGRPAAYHFADEGFGKPLRVPAERVFHGFQALRPGQLRGVSPFASAIMLAGDLKNYIQAEMDAAKLASKWLAIVETPDVAGFQGLRVSKDAATGQRIETLENAIIEYLRPGEKLNLSSHNRGGENFTSFVQFILRMVGVAANIPYELLSGDYSGLNYTALRGVRNDFRQTLEPRQSRLELRFCRRVFRSWLDREALRTGAFPGYFRDPSRYLRCAWIPVGTAEIDPLRELKADIEAVKAGLKSPQEIILRRGRDPEEVLDECAEWQALCRDRDLIFDAAAISTALAGNPAAVDPDTAEEADRALRRKA